MTLEDCLDGVYVGTFIRLSNKEGYSAAGYVVVYNNKTVKLSHEDPRRIDTWRKDTKDMSFLRGMKCFSGDRKYKLRHFDSYKIIDLNGE